MREKQQLRWAASIMILRKTKSIPVIEKVQTIEQYTN